MWVKIDVNVIINVDSKVVKIVSVDTQINEKTLWELAFYNSLENGAKPAYNYKFDSAGQRDEAFGIICQQLDVIDTTRIKR